MQHLFENIDRSLNLLANFFTVVLGIKSVWEIFKFIKSKDNNKKITSKNDKCDESKTRDTCLTQNINNNFLGYFSYNFKDSQTLTETEIRNYNYDSLVLWRWLYYSSFVIVLLYFIHYLNTANLEINWFQAGEIFNNQELILRKLFSSSAQALQQTFNLTWLAQFVVSILVIFKMISANNILYRKINITLYSLSLFFTWHLENIFSTLSFKDVNIFNLTASSSTTLSIENMKPLFVYYSAVILLLQLIYTIYILYSGIRILKIGEIKYLEKKIQFQKIYRGKYLILISPIVFSIVWYYFKLYVA